MAAPRRKTSRKRASSAPKRAAKGLKTQTSARPRRQRTGAARKRSPKARGGRTPRRRTSTFRSRLVKLLIPPGLALAVLCGAVSIHYLGKFSRWIDALLIENQPVSRVVLARPFEIRVGQRYGLSSLIRQLQRAGYEEGAESGRWRRRAQAGVEFGDGSERFSAAFGSGRLKRLSRNGRPLDALRLEPAFLSSMSFHSRKKRKPLTFDAYPSHLIDALVAAEDDRFFHHIGIDVLGLARAALVNLTHLELRQGGSTLTQQFAKNYFFSQERHWKRKVEEILMALMLERRLSKHQIFELYANEVYLGQVGSFAIHGLGQGASIFFGKECRDLTLSEAATLAAVVPSPNRLSPYRHAQAVTSRRNRILDRMERLQMISVRENVDARAQPLQVAAPNLLDSAHAPHFVDDLHGRLTSELGLDLEQPADLRIHSTLDLDLQQAAFEVVQSGLEKVEALVAGRSRLPRVQAAMLVADPRTGDVLALIGGRDYAGGQYNRATRALRQPGSTFKPFAYATAFEEAHRRNRPGEMTLSTALSDAPYTLRYGSRTYRPSNYQNRYFGTVSVRQALARSLNVPAVRVAQWAGFERIQEVAQAFGFQSRMEPYPSMALGSYEVSLLELTQGYQVLANGGVLVPLRFWHEVYSDGRVVQSPSRPAHRVTSAETAFFVTSALESVVEEGTARQIRRAGFDLPSAGKTGSTTDGWFAGYTPDLLCVVWVGTDRAPHLNLSGSVAALPLWIEFMKKAAGLGKLSGRDFATPPGVVRVKVDPGSGLRASRRCPTTRVEYYLPGAQPTRKCLTHDFAEAGRLGQASGQTVRAPSAAVSGDISR